MFEELKGRFYGLSRKQGSVCFEVWLGICRIRPRSHLFLQVGCDCSMQEDHSHYSKSLKGFKFQNKWCVALVDVRGQIPWCQGLVKEKWLE